MNIAVVVASGGLDSCVTAALAKKTNELALMHVQYGQRTMLRELQSFQSIAKNLNARKTIVFQMTHFSAIGGSSLTDQNLAIRLSGIEKQGIPQTYVPFRNANILSAAVSWAEVIGAKKIFIGVNSLDSSGYPDCRPEFIDAFNAAVKKGTRPDSNIVVTAPLLDKTKMEIVQLGVKSLAPIEKSWSCYKDSDIACGICDSCRLRIQGFQKAGYIDPIPYAIDIEWGNCKSIEICSDT